MLVYKHHGESGTENRQIKKSTEIPTLLGRPGTVATSLIACAQRLGVPREQLHLCSNLANPSRALVAQHFAWVYRDPQDLEFNFYSSVIQNDGSRKKLQFCIVDI